MATSCLTCAKKSNQWPNVRCCNIIPFSVKNTATGDIIIKFTKFIIQAAELGLDKGLDWVWKATEHGEVMKLSNMPRY
jgi:hypothetical protein